MGEYVPQLIHAVSTAADGNMDFRYGEPEQVIQNRQLFLAQHHIALGQCVVMDVEHKADIRQVGSDERGAGTRDLASAVTCDAVMSNERETALIVLTADCAPIMLCDPATPAIALIHAGWKSTEAQICRKTVEAMADTYGSDETQIQAHIGPTISKDSYIKNEPPSGDAWQPYLEQTSEGTQIDIVGYNIAQLTQAGIQPDHISVSDTDTATDDRYFSHYQSARDENMPEERFASVVMLQ